MISRVALAAVALAVVFWLAVLERDNHLQTQAEHAALAGKSGAAHSKLRSARFLNADTQPDFLRAVLLYGGGDPNGGRALLESVLRREPDNLPAWAQLRSLTRTSDPAASRHALAEMRRLDPLDVKAHRGL